MTEKEFIPYWLLHEPGKTSGFATVDLDSAITAEKAIEVWLDSDQCRQWDGIIDWRSMPIEARLITEPFQP